MPPSERVFQTDSIDLASFLAGSSFTPSTEKAPDGRRALFCFTESPELLAAVIQYERGAALSAKRLLNVRSWLYREASNVVKGVTK